MMYIGELLNPRSLRSLRRALIGVAAVFAISAAVAGASVLMANRKITAMKAEIASKQDAITDAKASAKEAQANPQTQVPRGLAAVDAFQSRLNKIAHEEGATVTEFNGSDQMNPFISAFATDAPQDGTWAQVEVRVNLQGTTQAVVNTLKNLDRSGLAYEFTSLEMSRAQASATGEATVTANVGLRVLTLPGGSA